MRICSRIQRLPHHGRTGGGHKQGQRRFPRKFAEKYDLPFILLSDPELSAIKAYDVWQEKKNYGKVSMGVVRTTYVIDENGIIIKTMPKVKPDTNAAEIIAFLKG